MVLRDVLQLDRPLHGLDLETTGTNPTTARIVEIGLEIMIPGEPTKERRTLVNPIMPIPPEATLVHGITDADVASVQPFHQIADNLLRGFANADFVGYNLRFDLRVLAAEFKRNNYAWSYEDARVLDGYRVWQIVAARSLEDAVEYWLGEKKAKREGREGAHGALWDATRGTRVLASQLDKNPQVPRTVQEIHDLCWPGWFDVEGKLKWRNGQLCLTFGKHRDESLRRVGKGYLRWIIDNEFSDKVKDTCRDALKGIYPSPPVIDDDDQDSS